MSKKNIIPVFVPHYGCPNDCVFCNQNKITGLTTDVTAQTVENTILEYLSYFKNKDNIEIAFYGGSFTAIETKIQEELLFVAKKYKDAKIVQAIRLSTRPDCINNEILDILKKYSVDTIELGVQSLNEEVLIKSNRGHDTTCVYKSAELIKNHGFNLGLQMMIGLPGDSIEKDLYTAKEFIKLNPDCVRIYPTLVIKDTALEYCYNNNLYDSLSIDEAVYITKEVLKLYLKNYINVIRVGLQPTDEIQYDASVVSGPFHPAFRQLVESEILYDVIVEYFKDKKIFTDLKIFANGKNISNIAGQKSFNKGKIINKLKIKDLSLKNKNYDEFTLELIYNGIKDVINIKDYI